MLILTRRRQEAIKIGNDITLTVLGIKGNQVRIGINAPKHLSVHRDEIYERIQEEVSTRGEDFVDDFNVIMNLQKQSPITH